MTDLRPGAARPVQALDVARQRGWTLTVLDIDAAYKQHLAEGELWLPFCTACPRFLPAWISRCADHWGGQMQLSPVTGDIRLWSWVEYRHAYRLPVDVQAPYIVVAVDIQSGPRCHGFILQPAAELKGLDRGAAMRLDQASTKALGTPVFELEDAGRDQA